LPDMWKKLFAQYVCHTIVLIDTSSPYAAICSCPLSLCSTMKPLWSLCYGMVWHTYCAKSFFRMSRKWQWQTVSTWKAEATLGTDWGATTTSTGYNLMNWQLRNVPTWQMQLQVAWHVATSRDATWILWYLFSCNLNSSSPRQAAAMVLDILGNWVCI
jgi:hypothetical protein